MVLVKDPGVLLKDPGVLLMDPGVEPHPGEPHLRITDRTQNKKTETSKAPHLHDLSVRQVRKLDCLVFKSVKFLDRKSSILGV